MKSQTIAITTTAKKQINKQTWNSSFNQVTDVGVETLVWDKSPLTKETKPDLLGQEQSGVMQTNSLQTQKTMILEELDGLLYEVESFILEEESWLEEESKNFLSHEQLELKELVEELEVSVKEL
ncbi:MAG: hypothetical protein AAGJ08_09080 [Cyanobacteria bacterium P01_H01_bin.35]